jgi:parallel beta-helix repeat protein
MKTLAGAILIGLFLMTAIFAQTSHAQAPESFSLIFIREDGSIDCANTPNLSVIPIKRQGEVYTLTGNIKSFGPGISIGCGGITLDGAGYTLQGSAGQNGQGGQGISFASYVVGVTVKNLKVTGFDTGISLNDNSGNFFIGNDVNNNLYNGYYLSNTSHNNTISGNKISSNPRWGIIIVGRESTYGGPSKGNIILGNTIQDNGWEKWTIPGYGMDDDYGAGVWLWAAVDNTFSGNKFVNNAQQVFVFDQGANIWSSGLPSGGNLWSDYSGVDADKDGIGDTPYVIDSGNSDPHPLVLQSSPNPPPDETNNGETGVDEESQFPLEYVVAAIAVLAVVIVVLLVFFSRRKRK